MAYMEALGAVYIRILCTKRYKRCLADLCLYYTDYTYHTYCVKVRHDSPPPGGVHRGVAHWDIGLAEELREPHGIHHARILMRPAHSAHCDGLHLWKAKCIYICKALQGYTSMIIYVRGINRLFFLSHVPRYWAPPISRPRPSYHPSPCRCR